MSLFSGQGEHSITSDSHVTADSKQRKEKTSGGEVTSQRTLTEVPGSELIQAVQSGHGRNGQNQLPKRIIRINAQKQKQEQNFFQRVFSRPPQHLQLQDSNSFPQREGQRALRQN